MAEEIKVDAQTQNGGIAPPWGAEKAQPTEVEKQIEAKLAAEAQRTKDEEAAIENARRQKEADEKVLTGDEGNGIAHMDLLRASFHIDGNLTGEPISPVAHQPQPENHEPAPEKVKWEPGK